MSILRNLFGVSAPRLMRLGLLVVRSWCVRDRGCVDDCGCLWWVRSGGWVEEWKDSRGVVLKLKQEQQQQQQQQQQKMSLSEGDDNGDGRRDLRVLVKPSLDACHSRA